MTQGYSVLAQDKLTLTIIGYGEKAYNYLLSFDRTFLALALYRTTSKHHDFRGN
jgi:hypothetical protein